MLRGTREGFGEGWDQRRGSILAVGHEPEKAEQWEKGLKERVIMGHTLFGLSFRWRGRVQGEPLYANPRVNGGAQFAEGEIAILRVFVVWVQDLNEFSGNREREKEEDAAFEFVIDFVAKYGGIRVHTQEASCVKAKPKVG
ncbi:hypothetical protein ACA910_014776 [Epithemia clementina (nom. ined.)]